MMLLSVLLIVALTAGVLVITLTAQDGALQRAQTLRDASQADAYIQGGTLSAVTALRRDGIGAPQTDNVREPWAQIGEHGTPIRGGTFALAISDAQDRFNINLLARGDLASTSLMRQIVETLHLHPEVAIRAQGVVTAFGGIGELAGLRVGGISDHDIAALSTMVTALPEATQININSVPEPLLALILGNPVTARSLINQRARAGYLAPDALIASHSLLPASMSYTSKFFWVRTRVTSGDASRQLTVLLKRDRAAEGVRVLAVARWRGAMPPIDAPALPEKSMRSAGQSM